MIEKTIMIDGVEETFRCSARTPRIYRNLMNSDMFQDMNAFSDAQAEAGETNEEVPLEDLDGFYNMAYVMAYHAAMHAGRLETFPKNIDEWLEKFSMLGLAYAVPEIYELWLSSNSQQVEAKNV